MKPIISEPIAQVRARTAQTSATALISQCLEEANNTTSVFTRLYPEAALAVAAHADALRNAGVELPPLAGLPVSIKDLLDVAGETTMAGSLVLKDALPAKQDAPVVRRLRAAGAAIIGKTNMTEFAFSGLGLNPHYGTPVNPADSSQQRIPGGSSSGAAVSLALGLCVAAIGSDTGGSIRIPAALCGMVGFKPTARRVPTAGATPLSTTLDTICAMTRSVDDCILIDSLLADAPLAVPRLALTGVRSLRLAVPGNVLMDSVDEHVAASFSDALTRLSEAGAQIVVLPLPMFNDLAKLNRFSPAEAYAWHREMLAAREAEYDPRVGARIALGANLSAADYIGMQAARRAWITQVEQALFGFDALIMPTVPVVAPPIAQLQASDDEYFRLNALMLRNPSSINYLDGCAISLPCHAEGSLPVGLTLASTAMQDAHLLAVARAVEQALG